jgi:hypothetical protein
MDMSLDNVGYYILGYSVANISYNVGDNRLD